MLSDGYSYKKIIGVTEEGWFGGTLIRLVLACGLIELFPSTIRYGAGVHGSRCNLGRIAVLRTLTMRVMIRPINFNGLISHFGGL